MTKEKATSEKVDSNVHLAIVGVVVAFGVLFLVGMWQVSHLCFTDKPAEFCFSKRLSSLPGAPHEKKRLSLQ
jgi:hypothetical protein